MDDPRAYTYLDAGTALVGNAWLERSWSAFIGNTISMMQKADDFEWIRGKSPEFRMQVNGESIGVMELGSIEWSEMYTPFGAGLTARQMGSGLVFVMGAFAFHKAPAIIRSCRIMNVSESPATVSQVRHEVLPIRHEKTAVVTEHFSRIQAEAVWETTETDVAVLLPDRGLIIGMEGGGVFELFRPDPGLCAFGLRQERTLARGEIWALPETFMLPFTGPFEEAARSLFLRFLEQRERMKEWEAEVEHEKQWPHHEPDIEKNIAPNN